MAGVPHHAAHGYIGRMLEAGHRIAICEQMADPKMVKGIVPREVVRVLSPGLITHDDHLKAGRNNWLAAVDVGRSQVTVALLDISTGELRVASLPNLTATVAELVHAAPREVLLGSVDDELAAEANGALIATLGAGCVRPDPAVDAAALSDALGELAGDAEVFSSDE